MFSDEKIRKTYIGELLNWIPAADPPAFFADFALLLYDLEKTGEVRLTEPTAASWKAAVCQCYEGCPELYPLRRPPMQISRECAECTARLLEALCSEPSEIRRNASAVLNELLQMLIDRRQFPHFITPVSLAEMMAEMIEPAPGEDLLDPVCGSGRLLSAASARCRSCAACGVEINRDLAAAAFVGVHLSGGAVSLHCEDFFDFASGKPGSFDAVLANPPYDNNISLTLHFAEAILRVLKPGGRCGILVPEGFLTATANSRLVEARRRLLEEYTFEGAVALPMKIYKPYMMSHSSLLLLRKEKPDPKNNIFFSRIPEYEGAESDFPDIVYRGNMNQVVDAWRYHKKHGFQSQRAADAVYWTASQEDIRRENYIFAADTYRPSLYAAEQMHLAEALEQIRGSQKKLEALFQ